MIQKVKLDLDLGAFGSQEVKFLYTYHPGLPRIISDHWGGAPEEPPSVELIAATFQGRDVLPLITEDAMDVITDRILANEGEL